ncbi:lipase member H-like isoform X2 [Daphnia pulicaria]|uniref:lipase member H-like isoform X2 n=1 Tax=Daphnia pulicaria TaxID=35523 RepID=UPI001EEC476E|nr:lipase member H-like isoform X2 [Daphnia pulicaria]
MAQIKLLILFGVMVVIGHSASAEKNNAVVWPLSSATKGHTDLAELNALIHRDPVKRQTVLLDDEDEERDYRWQESVFSFIKGVFRSGARSMGGNELNEIKSFCHFNLWTRTNPKIAQALLIDDEATLSKSSFNRSNPTKVFVHGWRMNGHSDVSMLTLRNEFLIRENCNFIAVDWESFAATDYFSSAAKIRPIGVFTGDFLNFLIKQGLNVSQLHIIGFSLGAHIAGKAGFRVNVPVPRITGLDPAFPGFSIDNTDGRLDVTDAQFVDIIHTNSDSLLNGGLSFTTSIGHVDFWPNGGIVQPGCSLISCSHYRALIYFTESINTKKPFTATKCSTHMDWYIGLCANNTQTAMGFSVSTSAKGDYFLLTNVKAPFALG